MAAVPFTEVFWFKKLSLKISIGCIFIVLLEALVALLEALEEALAFLDLLTAIRSLESIYTFVGVGFVVLVALDLFSGFGSGFFSSLGFSGSGFLGSSLGFGCSLVGS